MIQGLYTEQSLRLHFATLLLNQDYEVPDAMDDANLLTQFVLEGEQLPDIEEPESVSITICLPYSPALLED